MKPLDPQAFLTLDEVCHEVNGLRRRYAPVARTGLVGGRTVRFYVEKELLPPVRSGPGKKYAYETVWKVLFIRLLQAKHGLPLNQMRQALREVDVDTMRRVVTGEEPLEVLSGPSDAATERHASKGYQVVALTGTPASGVEPADGGGPGADDWHVLLHSRDVVLKARAGLSPAKRRQMQQIAELVRSILDAD